jgi:hypothetical protein
MYFEIERPFNERLSQLPPPLIPLRFPENSLREAPAKAARLLLPI